MFSEGGDIFSAVFRKPVFIGLPRCVRDSGSVGKNPLKPVQQSRAYEFSMWFAGKNLPRLDRTEFRPPDRSGSMQCLRGYKGPPGKSSQGGVTKASLRWSNGVKAMCLFFLQACGSLRPDPMLDFSFEGGRGTPAGSLDQVLALHLPRKECVAHRSWTF